VIEVVDLRKRFRKTTAVDGLTFKVRDGLITGFLGPNGAGKTTTLRILLGLVHPTSGKATIDARRYRLLEEPARRVGAVLEATNFHPKRSGRNHLRVLAAAAGIPTSRVDELLDFVGLGSVARRRVGGYSLGMRQRLSVAGALLGDPQLLVLDEPANGLDPQGIRWLRDLLRGLAVQGRTVLVSSHVLAEIAQLADDVVIIAKGRSVAQSSMEAVLAGVGRGTRVRSPERDRLLAALGREGIEAAPYEQDALIVKAEAPRVGELAARERVVLHELVAESGTLEDVFLELTEGESTPS
jgi:ABC-2 type transport system ATP-binding protein